MRGGELVNVTSYKTVLPHLKFVMLCTNWHALMGSKQSPEQAPEQDLEQGLEQNLEWEAS